MPIYVTGNRMALGCRLLRSLLLFCLAALVLAVSLAPDMFSVWAKARFDKEAVELQQWQSITLALLAGSGLCLLIQVLNCLISMYGEFSGNEPLSIRAANCMRSAAMWLFAFAGFVFIVEAPMSYIFSYYNPVGERFISLQMGAIHFASLLTAAVFLSVAQLQKHAAEIREDQKLIV